MKMPKKSDNSMQDCLTVCQIFSFNFEIKMTARYRVNVDISKVESYVLSGNWNIIVEPEMICYLEFNLFEDKNVY